MVRFWWGWAGELVFLAAEIIFSFLLPLTHFAIFIFLFFGCRFGLVVKYWGVMNVKVFFKVLSQCIWRPAQYFLSFFVLVWVPAWLPPFLLKHDLVLLSLVLRFCFWRSANSDKIDYPRLASHFSSLNLYFVLEAITIIF